MTTTVGEAIEQLENSSKYLWDLSNHPKIYNTDLGYYFAIASKDIAVHKAYLKETASAYGDLV